MISSVNNQHRIIRSSHFTFLVGQEQTPLTIHSAIVQNISEPLYALINNGFMKESTNGVAILDDVETETFIAFCEYAYTGAYVTPDRKESSNNASTDDQENMKPTMGPLLDFSAPSQLDAESEDTWGFSPATKKSKYRGKGAYYDGTKANSKHKSEPVQVDVVYPDEALWAQFRSRSFGVKSALRAMDPDIVFHAKLYVFATKYLVEKLRQQCLKSLHRDLRRFSLNRESASLVLDLLDFTYANTGRYEPGGKSPLRDLVIHYIACFARTLGDDERFTEILDSNAEMGSDLVAKLVR